MTDWKPGSIMTLKEHNCRWPLGDPSQPEFRFCCDQVEIPGRPYCAKHAGIAYAGDSKSAIRSTTRHAQFVVDKEAKRA